MLSQVHLQGAGLEMEEPGLEPEILRDADLTNYGLACGTPVPAPKSEVCIL